MELTQPPQTHYVNSGGFDLAYQVVGDGELDLIWLGGFATNIDLMWDVPAIVAWMTDLASWARVITFDKRGSGQSERVPPGQMPTLEDRLADLAVVQNAAGSSRAALVGDCEGGALGALYAATFPQRVSHLVLSGAVLSPLDSTLGDHLVEGWGTGVSGEYWTPSLIDLPGVRAAWGRWERSAVTRAGVQVLLDMAAETDVRGILPAITVPTLVLHRDGDRVAPVDHARQAAATIPSCELRILPGVDHPPWYGDSGSMLRELRRFLTGDPAPPNTDRILTTLLFTDLVGSTQLATSLGDAAWSERLELHDHLADHAVKQHGGRMVKHTGDGILASFSRPGDAIRCATHVTRQLSEAGLAVRCGIHTGECEIRGDDLGGIALHIAARVLALAQPHEVLVTRTVRDLVAGSAITFDPRGIHPLRGIDGHWELHAAR